MARSSRLSGVLGSFGVSMGCDSLDRATQDEMTPSPKGRNRGGGQMGGGGSLAVRPSTGAACQRARRKTLLLSDGHGAT